MYGECLTHMRDNNSPEVRFYTDLLRALIQRDLTELWSSTEQALRDSESILLRVAREGLPFLTVGLPALGKALDKAISNDTAFTSPPGFKTRKGGRLPILFGDLFASVFDDGGEHLPPSDIKHRSIAGIRQLTYVFYKLELPYSNEHSRRAIQNFVDTDQALPNREGFDVNNDPILRSARRLIGTVLSGLDCQNIAPRHGPGAVATGECTRRKSEFRRIYSTLEAKYPFTEYMVWSLSHLCDDYAGPGATDHLEVIDVPTAKLVLVPKDSRGPRIISEEPLEIQWIQQGIKAVLYRRVETHPYTRNHVNFTDQEINRNMALSSSLTGGWDTLDMKDASDRVSIGLFESLFSATEFYSAALASRSSAVKLPDGRIAQLNKFASMGSALCFPVEALTFWALCVSTLQACMSCSWAFARGLVYVFGDDIVVPSEYSDAVITTLERYGLLFNKDKCCRGRITRFRESCGLDAVEGVVVTPIRIKRRPIGAFVDWVPSYIEQSNALYTRGLKAAAEVLERMVRCTKLPVPIADESYQGLAFKRPYACAAVNTHLKRRRNRHLQRIEYRVIGVCNEKSRPLYDGWRELLRSQSEKAYQSSSAGPKKRTYSKRNGDKITFAWSCPSF